MGTRESHGAAKTQLEAKLDELVGLLPAAVEGMGDPPRHAKAAQLFEHRVDGAPHMQKDRQASFTSNLKLRRKPELLTRIIARIDETIKADFANGQRLLASNGFTQYIEIFVAGAIDIHGMNPIGRPAGRLVPANRCNSPEIRALNGGHDDQSNPGFGRSQSHRITITVKLRGIEMAVGVNQHLLFDFVDPGLLDGFELFFAAVAFVFLEPGQ